MEKSDSRSRVIQWPEFRWLLSGVVWTVAVIGNGTPTNSFADPPADDSRGAEIYTNQCADCHGDRGQGVFGVYDDPLTGDLPQAELAAYVHETMPEGDPESCVGADAEAVTAYIMDAFYSRDARLRNDPPEIQFSRLTVDQYLNSISDLMIPFLGRVPLAN